MAIYRPTESTGTALPIDRTSFVGGTVPEEIKIMMKPLKELDKDTFRKTLQVIVASLEGEEVTYDKISEIQTEKLTQETFAVIYTGLYKLLQLGLRLPQSSIKQEIFKEDLAQLNIPEEFVDDIASVVFGSRRKHIDRQYLENRPRLPKLDNFRWKVDVTISTSVLNRVLEPSILMEMTLSNGKVHTFEVPVSKFHELRYNVAYLLKEMEDLEKRAILKIQD